VSSSASADRVHEEVERVVDPGRVDAGGAAALDAGVGRVRADDRDPAGAGERQRGILVAQQRHTAGGRLPGERVVLVGRQEREL
jgi:hypothetical protein